MRAREIMTTPVLTLGAGTTAREAASRLAERGFSAAPVVAGDDRLVGIVTVNELTGAAGQTVGEVMRAPAASAGPDTDVVDLTSALLGSGQPAMPIVDGARVVGIVTRHDLMRVGRDDASIARDVRRKLEVYGGPHHWEVHVDHGVVTIGDDATDDQTTDETDRQVAAAVAEAVPGVVRAEMADVDDER
jgi:signal-transduction protein with cAMP-binding, CBS, and nucleotidyltransferase domain